MNEIQMEKDDIKNHLEIIYRAQMQMAKEWVQNEPSGELWGLIDDLVSNLRSELEMVA